MPNIGPLELAIVLIIALVIFGPKRLPDLGRSLGKGMREFKDSISGNDNDDDEAAEQAKLEMQASQPQPPPPTDDEPVEGEVVADQRS
jgi:sec-independent protein translocase protein TatA